MDMPLDFEQLKISNLEILNENRLIYLATSYGGRVRSRTVDYYNRGLQIGFITWIDTVKIEHIKNNPTVALCLKNLQIEGKAKLAGHPGLPENRDFMGFYKERNPIAIRPV